MKLNTHFKQALSLSILALIMTLPFQNCSKVAVSEIESSTASSVNNTAGTDDDNNGSPPAPVCETRLIDTLRTVKVLFLIDTSGSNVINQKTDPEKRWRKEVLTNFISRYESKSNFHYGLVTFQNDSAKAQILENGKAVFTNDMTAVKAGVDAFLNTPDSGATPYKPTLKLAQEMIAADLIAHPSDQTSYAVVMISDGMPTDYGNTPSNIIPDVESVVKVAPKQISLNSVFYYGASKDLSQTAFLELIAKYGNGSFVTANSNESLQIDDIMKVPQVTCH